MSVLIFPAGSFTKDTADPPTEDGQGLIFDDDGVVHLAGSSAYVPLVFRNPNSSIYLTFSFMPVAPGVAGDAQFDLTYYVSGDSGGVISTGSHTLLVPFDGSMTVMRVTLDITPWLSSSNTRLLFFTISRNSSNPGDTLATGAALMLAYTNEI